MVTAPAKLTNTSLAFQLLTSCPKNGYEDNFICNKLIEISILEIRKKASNGLCSSAPLLLKMQFIIISYARNCTQGGGDVLCDTLQTSYKTDCTLLSLLNKWKTRQWQPPGLHWKCNLPQLLLKYIPCNVPSSHMVPPNKIEYLHLP